MDEESLPSKPAKGKKKGRKGRKKQVKKIKGAKKDVNIEESLAFEDELEKTELQRNKRKTKAQMEEIVEEGLSSCESVIPSPKKKPVKRGGKKSKKYLPDSGNVEDDLVIKKAKAAKGKGRGKKGGRRKKK